MDTENTTKVEVIVTAIDGDNLVLETVPNKNMIRWPLKNIPRPLPVGGRLTLELQKDAGPQTGLQINNGQGQVETTVSINRSDREDRMRKMLEELVN